MLRGNGELDVGRDGARRRPRVSRRVIYGGSGVVCDLDARVALSYVMNRTDDRAVGAERGADLWRAVYESLEG